MQQTAFDASELVQPMQELEQRTSLGGLPVRRLPGWLLQLAQKIPGPWGRAARTWPTLQSMWSRYSSDDLSFMLLLAINDFITPVPSTQVNQGDARSFVSMCTKCRQQILDCVNDPQCKAALEGLEKCGLNDQVRSPTCQF